ncbi:hypothetical protein HOY82DRAFT_618511 [Tuber indicum]|nr:hypothetical protein HOY82DRAFT_618511 [Tuber indicum]
MKVVEKVLEEFTAGMREDKEEMKELEAKNDQKHEDPVRGILGLTDEIYKQSPLSNNLKPGHRLIPLLLIIGSPYTWRGIPSGVWAFHSTIFDSGTTIISDSVIGSNWIWKLKNLY